jgi:hypothetical protein
MPADAVIKRTRNVKRRLQEAIRRLGRPEPL